MIPEAKDMKKLCESVVISTPLITLNEDQEVLDRIEKTVWDCAAKGHPSVKICAAFKNIDQENRIKPSLISLGYIITTEAVTGSSGRSLTIRWK